MCYIQLFLHLFTNSVLFYTIVLKFKYFIILFKSKAWVILNCTVYKSLADSELELYLFLVNSLIPPPHAMVTPVMNKLYLFILQTSWLHETVYQN